MAVEISRAEDDERHRVARGLHDDLGQLLVTAKVRLHALGRDLPPSHETELKEVAVLLDQAVAATRSLSFELMAPPTLELDIEAPLAELAESMEERHGVTCTFASDRAPKPLSRDVARALYRVVRELLANAASHAYATTTCVEVTTGCEHVQVVVADDGVGLAASVDAPPECAGVGLLIVTERMAQVGGDVHIESSPGEGTRVTVTVPLDPAAPDA